MESAGLISNAVGMACVAGKFEWGKVREGAVYFLYEVVASSIMQPSLPLSWQLVITPPSSRV
jgi:hypothetical protein